MFSSCSHAIPRRFGAATLALALVLLASPVVVRAQNVNQVLTVSPASAAQGAVGVTVTFTLDTDSPPAPPAGVAPSSVSLGTLAGTAVTHASQYTVTAAFTIPAGQAVGTCDATVVFSTPNGTLTFSKSAAFSVTASSGAPQIAMQPQSRTVAPGAYAAFSVAATGSSLAYQWQRNGADLAGRTAATLVLDPVAAGDSARYRCRVSNTQGSVTSAEAALTLGPVRNATFLVMDTKQAACYDTASVIACPAPGQAWYGQDGEVTGHVSQYVVSTDGRTVYDTGTGLTWQRTTDTNADGTIDASDKLTWANAQLRPAALNAVAWGGFTDWRLPSIKEMYSLIDFRGTDPSGYSGTDTSVLTPFIDTSAFKFGYGQTSAGERIIDAQYASSTLYTSAATSQLLFGVNFADGRIKGYGLTLNGSDKTFYVQCVRGNTAYGLNDFVNNSDSTVTDRATALMWDRADSRYGMKWTDALAWVQAKNAANWRGYSDWRLPDTKELESIVDYTRSPDATASAAIDPVFVCTPIVNEAFQADWPWYWSGTTHANYTGGGASGCYVTFGRGLGYMGGWVDIHGAGCQRSDPKGGSLTSYSFSGNGYYNSIAPQGDAIRMYNYVRLVRGTAANSGVAPPPAPGSRLGVLGNPARGAVAVRFALAAPAAGELVVCDVSGRRVATLARGTFAAGERTFTWDGRTAGGAPAAAGVYFVRLHAGMTTRTVRAVLLR